MKNKTKSKFSFIIGTITTLSLFTAFTIGYFTTSDAATPPKILFGIGTEAVDAIDTPLVKETPTKMLTSWYNGPNDLNWMDDSWHVNEIDDMYSKGYTHHIITYSNDSEGSFSSSKGQACGRQYPVSTQFVDDMGRLAEVYKGSGAAYFTLMTEFQDYSCQDNQWQGSENYFNAMKASYLAAMQKIRQVNPNAKVSLGWGGWQTRFNNTSTGSGRALFPYFEDVMRQSQFQSFQAMQSDSNVNDIREMTKVLGAYGPVMLAHYKPDNSSQSTFENDLKAIFTDSYLQEMTGYGLFAFSFMDAKNMSASGSIFSFIKDAVNKYASSTAQFVPAPTAVVTPKPTAVPTKTPTPTVKPSGTATATPVVAAQNAYNGEYFNNKTLSGSPTTQRSDSTINFDWAHVSPISGLAADNFSVRWTKQHQFENAMYKFTTTSDDGIRLYVDNELLIDQWNDHAPTVHSFEKSLTAGAHTIRYEFYEYTGGAVAKLQFEKIGTATAPIVTPSATPVAGQTKISIFAAGTPALGAYPSMNLVVNGTKAATYTNVRGNPKERQFEEFVYTSQTPVTGPVKIEFTNNAAGNGEDRNLTVDKVVVNGTLYETEGSNVYSKGSYNSATGCAAGYKKAETLHCSGGYFQY
jgi:hypothetical protein